MALSDLDENHFNKCLRHKQNQLFSPQSTSVNHDTTPPSSKSTYFSENGEKIVVRLTKSQRRLTDTEMEQIIIAYQNGKTTYELATRYSCNRKTISQNLKKHGVHVSKDKAQKKINIKEVIEMYTAGQTVGQIAKHFSVSASTIQRCLRDEGVTIRTRWDYAK